MDNLVLYERVGKFSMTPMRYYLTDKSLFYKNKSTVREIPLEEVKGCEVRQRYFQRIFSIYDVYILLNDLNGDVITLKNVKNGNYWKNLIFRLRDKLVK